MGKQWKQWGILFSWAPESLHMVTTAMKLKDTCFLEDKLDGMLKSRDTTLLTKVHVTSTVVFQESWWELDHKEGWVPKNWCFWTVVLEKTLEKPLCSKETKPVNPEGNQSWIFIGGTKAKAPILWPLYMKSQLNSLEKTLILGKIEGRRRRGQKKMRWLDGIIDSTELSLSNLREIVKDRKAWHAALHGVVRS